MEGVEAGEGVGAEAGYGGTDAVEGLAAHVAALGVEFVGVADQLFKQSLGKIIGGRERQVLGLDVLTGDSGAGVTLGHTRHRLVDSQLSEQARSYHSVGKIRLRAMAVD